VRWQIELEVASFVAVVRNYSMQAREPLNSRRFRMCNLGDHVDFSGLSVIKLSLRPVILR
jgi:hypothetical protein